jgi:AcrR family transcriptional regulator
VAERVEELFEEYATAYARGERPQAREFLARAGGEVDDLGRLIDAFLTRAPAPVPDAQAVELFEAWQAGESPLLRLRTARGVTRDAVVGALVRTLGLDVKKKEKVERYYHELESGLLQPERVDRRVWDVLAETLGARVSDLVGWLPRPPAFPAVAFARASQASGMLSVSTMAQEKQEEEDEIDRLFHST